jgi:hypothetical protein
MMDLATDDIFIYMQESRFARISLFASDSGAVCGGRVGSIHIVITMVLVVNSSRGAQCTRSQQPAQG